MNQILAMVFAARAFRVKDGTGSILRKIGARNNRR